MKFNTKSRKGFTLIELLVVIGILAVLAAIAIPAVAGLIDRANVSADATNANEMTNAIERFASEYELYCQDIASGTLDTNNLDAAQGRVYNVTKATVRSDIEALEKDAYADEDTEGIAIYRDTKYPVNRLTAKTIIRNYTKTSSSTFDPKQSDMHFWYSPDCGVVVTGKPSATASDLNKNIKSGKDAKGNNLTGSEVWIDLTIDADPLLNPIDIVPEGAVYYVGCTPLSSGLWFPGEYKNYTAKYSAGEKFPNEVKDGDVYVCDGYEYRYNLKYVSGWTKNTTQDGWGVYYIKRSGAPSDILETINGKPITEMNMTFYQMNITRTPKIPDTVKQMGQTFYQSSITVAPILPKNLTYLYCTFYGCSAIKTYTGSTDTDGNFSNYVIPDGVTNMQATFYGCKLITNAPVIPQNVINMASTFSSCTSLTGNIKINSNPTTWTSCLYNTQITSVTGKTSMASKFLKTVNSSAYNPQ